MASSFKCSPTSRDNWVVRGLSIYVGGRDTNGDGDSTIQQVYAVNRTSLPHLVQTSFEDKEKKKRDQ